MSFVAEKILDLKKGNKWTLTVHGQLHSSPKSIEINLFPINAVKKHEILLQYSASDFGVGNISVLTIKVKWEG